MSFVSPADPRAWRADTLDAADAWRIPLSPSCMAALEPTLADQRRAPRPVTEVRLPAAARAACRAALRSALDALEVGRGFVVLAGPPPQELPPGEATLLYWLVGQALGQPFEQNVQGMLLYDVRDTGQDVAYGARFSVTNAESSFHTDNSFGDTVLDYVGLLCLASARSGGRSQVVSGRTVCERLAAADPAALEELGRPFHFDRRGGVRPGEAATARFPVLQRRGDGPLYRYLRYWIETGQQKAGEPLTLDRRRALDVLDGWLGRPELRAEFDLRPGDMFFINNRWLLHNRTAFEDHPEPERRRHYVRLWLHADGAGQGGEPGA
jgi:alpha-ketoglutarate-dependent taurine dioxygenase